MFAIKLLLSSDRDNPNNDLFSGDSAAHRYALRRYLYRASESDLAAALEQVPPTFERLSTSNDLGWNESELCNWLPFAFSRGTDWADVLLHRWVGGDEVQHL